MEQEILQLKKDFNAQLRAFPMMQSSLAHLTDEELKELQDAWVDLSIWKMGQSDCRQLSS